MTQAIDHKLSFWTAAFQDAATEAEYRRWNHPTALSRASLVAILIIIATLPHLYSVHLRFGFGPEFQLLLATRLAVTGLAVLLLAAVWRRVRPVRLDRLVLASSIALIAQTILLSALTGPILKLLDVQFILLVLFIYIFTPNRFLYRLVPCCLLSAAFIAQVIWHYEMGPAERSGLIAWMAAANFFGIYASHQSERLRRREFANLERLRIANAELRISNRDLDRARAAAERESRAKTDFLANVSHELRTPLNAINGFSEVIKKELFGPIGNARYRSYIDDIHRSGIYLLSLIDDLLDLAKAEAGKLELRESEVDIAALAEDSLRFVSEAARHRGVLLQAEIPRNLPRIRADERACRQILLNLLSNAVKFSTAAGTVTIQGGIHDSGDLLLSVSDTGIGIAPEDVPRVLQPFGQAGARPGDSPRGTGLGLPLSLALVQAHGGSLQLDSAPGRGTTVLVRLPARRVARPGQAESPPSTASSAPVT